ncbi:hypothetical protein [Dyella amyloliquefaciens]|uniref:hypothetical protein n=1 Tax=Dyella amyloliquefaciens TaxID=1770545 RepID=UPI00102E66A8|nr:hypothetical protein [Dyella amyloliquefaciens]
MGYAVKTMQHSLSPFSTFRQTIWRLMSERHCWVHLIQEKAARIASASHRQTKLAELNKVIAPMIIAGLVTLNCAGVLPVHCLLKSLVYAAIGIGVVAVVVRLLTAQSRRLGDFLRQHWRLAWRLDHQTVISFERPPTHAMSVLASDAASSRASLVERDSQEQARLLRERAGLIALMLSPRVLPIPTQIRGA